MHESPYFLFEYFFFTHADASPLTKRSVAPNTLEVVAPPKPARSLENLPLATIKYAVAAQASQTVL